MFPPVIEQYLDYLPELADLKQSLSLLNDTKSTLIAVAENKRSLSSQEQQNILELLDRAISQWRLKRQFNAEFNKLCGLVEVARGLDVATRNLTSELKLRGVQEPLPLIQQIVSSLLGSHTLTTIPARQLEIVYQVMEKMLHKLTSGKLTPPLRPTISDDVLETLSDEALEELPHEDPVLASTRRLIDAVVRYARSYQLNQVPIDPIAFRQQSSNFQTLPEVFHQHEKLTYDICELIHEHAAIDYLGLAPENTKFIEFLFPSEIVVHEPSPEMQDSWREVTLQRQIRADMENTLSDCIRSNPVANALMAEFAQTKKLKTYEEARWMVLAETRKSLETRVAAEIFKKASDEFAGKEVIHRYPVAIPAELTERFAQEDNDGAMQLSEDLALQLLQKILPELYQYRHLVEQ